LTTNDNNLLIDTAELRYLFDDEELINLHEEDNLSAGESISLAIEPEAIKESILLYVFLTDAATLKNEKIQAMLSKLCHQALNYPINNTKFLLYEDLKTDFKEFITEMQPRLVLLWDKIPMVDFPELFKTARIGETILISCGSPYNMVDDGVLKMKLWQTLKAFIYA
jgi:hypothetical protein